MKKIGVSKENVQKELHLEQNHPQRPILTVGGEKEIGARELAEARKSSETTEAASTKDYVEVDGT
ncbi:hypothetical protein E5D57_002360 [Metarhizium anisopliae]|nr:hypothetical protein E5D57_002360 [Metarhizium anisopliae]